LITEELMEEFSQRIKRMFVDSVSIEGWRTTCSASSTFCYIGDSRFYFIIRMLKEGLIRFEPCTFNGRKQDFLKVFQELVLFFEEKGMDTIVIQFIDGEYESKASGVKSKLFLQIIEELDFMDITWDGCFFHNDKRLEDKYYLFLDYENTCVEMKYREIGNWRSVAFHSVEKFSSVQEVQTYNKKKKEFQKELFEKEKEFLPIIQQYDKTAFFDKNDLSFVLYGKKYSLYIKKVGFYNERVTYKGRIGKKYIQNKNIDIVLDRMKDELKKYLVKNRVTATVEGRASNFIDTFLFEILGKRKVNTNFVKRFDTEFTEGEFNFYLKERIGKIKPVVLSDVEKTHYQKELKKSGKSHKVKNGYHYDDLIVLVSASKIHILRQTNVEQTKTCS